MSIVEIKLHNRIFKISCNDESKNRLLEIAKSVNNKLENIVNQNSTASFDLQLVILLLTMQDQLDDMCVNTKRTLCQDDDSDINNEDEKFAETLSTMAQYLENISQKLAKKGR